MKLSNKILLGFFGFIFIYLSASFAEIRLRGNQNRFVDTEGVQETIDIPESNYLVLHDLKRSIKVIGSERSSIEVRSFTGEQLKHLNYHVSGDTLTLLQLDSIENKPTSITIYVPSKTFKGLTNEGAYLNIESLDQQLLVIKQNDGWIGIKDSKLGKLDIAAINDANFNMSKTDLDTLAALVDHAEIRIDNEVNIVNGSMTNKSYLRVKGVDEIQLKTDKSSKMDLN